MLLTTAACLSFSPVLQPHPLPAMAPVALRAARTPSMLLDGATTQWLADAAVLLPDSSAADAAAAAAAQQDVSWFDFVIVKPCEFCIVSIHNTLKSAGVDEAYGPSIIMFTLLLKLLTFPLNKQQIESTSKMQAIQPRAKELQEKYRNKDPARLNAELQKLYQDNQVNPLAGCLPSLAQIPIFIGLYRSVLNLATADKLTESFLWLPSLEGPVSDYKQGSGWLFGNAELGYAWNGLTPPLGWHDTLCYLVLPVLLVISQYISTAILTPKTDDPQQQQSQAILKFLPLMIGWFSLNVPSGLGLYWMTNNLVTTLSTVLIRRNVNGNMPDLATAGASAPVVIDEPPRAQGFTPAQVTKTAGDGTTVTISPPGSKRAERRKAAATDALAGATVVEAVATTVDAEAPAEDAASPDGGVASAAPKKKKKASKKKKKRSN